MYGTWSWHTCGLCTWFYFFETGCYIFSWLSNLLLWAWIIFASLLEEKLTSLSAATQSQDTVLDQLLWSSPCWNSSSSCVDHKSCRCSRTFFSSLDSWWWNVPDRHTRSTLASHNLFFLCTYCRIFRISLSAVTTPHQVYPHLFICSCNKRRQRKLQRRYVMWGVSSIMWTWKQSHAGRRIHMTGARLSRQFMRFQFAEKLLTMKSTKFHFQNK